MSKPLPRQEGAGSMEDKRLHLIRLLYGEALPNGMAPDEDPELAAEWRALQEVKGWLDAQPRHRPDPVVLDRLEAAAARSVAVDRPARRQTLRRGRWRVAIGMLTLLVVIGGLWYQFWTDVPLEQAGTVVAEQVPTTPEPLELQPWLQRIAPMEMAGRPEAASLLQWDDREAVQQVYRQLQILKARSTPGWEPALPLEAWPTGHSQPGLRPASRRNN